MPDISEIYGGWDMKAEHPDLKDDNKCCGQAMRIWLIICNIILLILACACFGVGIYVQAQPAFKFTVGSLGVGCILLGLILLILGLMGLFAAWRRSSCCLGIYSSFITLLVLGQMGALIVAATASHIAVSAMNKTWTGMSTEYKDFIGLFYGCCQVRSDSLHIEKLTGHNSSYNFKDWEICRGESDLTDKQKTKKGGFCESQGLVWKNEGYGKATMPFYSLNKVKIGNTTTSKTYRDHCTNATATTTKDSAGKITDGYVWVKPEDEDICTCKYTKGDAGKGINPVDTTCRQLKGTIPYCHNEVTSNTTAKQWFTSYPFAVGASDKRMEAGKIDSAVASCYAKFENWLAAHMVSAIVILVLLFLYQIFNVGFACALWCGACGKKTAGGDGVEEEPNDNYGVGGVGASKV